MSEIAKLAKHVGLSDKEWAHLKLSLGRDPSEAELQMIGVMWSEHCSYKSSKRYLKKLRTTGAKVLQGPGENAGLVELDSKRAVAFKVESHNHPSFVEPFQGAATGVGGILRDIFTMGARPIAVGDYLRFGDLQTQKHQFLLDGVVSGIAHYGNCIGIPTVAGEVRTDSSYNGNILVNVFAMGLADKSKIFKAATAEAGNSMMIWGAKTGRDGIHGASLLASADFSASQKEETQKIRVQVGDPFKEKCLMEATLECMKDLSSDLVAIQDMGAAGLTCSTMEIAYKSGIGMDVDLNKVPMRETGMQAFELLLSESQERMLAVVRPGSEEKFTRVLEKWNCDAAVIGQTVPGEKLTMTFNGTTVVDLPVQKLMDPPDADLPAAEFEVPAESKVQIQLPTSEWDELTNLLRLPSIASKRAIYQRYDSTVGGGTLLGPGNDAAVLWVGETDADKTGVAFKGICNEQYAGFDPQSGIELSMLNSIRGLSCVGAELLGYTDGVNLGNPNSARTLGALDRTIQGMNRISEAFDLPCISGNVSLYNQTVVDDKARDILPTIFAVIVGKIPNVDLVRPAVFQKAGSEVWLVESLNRPADEVPMGSAYMRMKTGGQKGIPAFDIQSEKLLQSFLKTGLEKEVFLSLRSVSEGGLAVTLAKACFGLSGDKKPFGFDGDLSKVQQRRDSLLFGEAGGRVIVEVDASKRSDLMRLSMDSKISVKRLGAVTTDSTFCLKPTLTGDVGELLKAWTGVFQ